MLANIYNKNVLFITTKNIDYIRNLQEIELLRKDNRDVKLIHSKSNLYFVRILSVYYQLLFQKMEEFDVVFIGFSPQLVLPLFFWKFKNKKVIIDFFISMYDTLVFDRKKFKINSHMARVLKWLDTRTLNLANRAIADTITHSRYFMDEFNVSKDKFEICYLKADQSIYYVRNVNRKKELEGKFIVLYFGSILPLQGIEVVMESMKLVLEREKDVFFYIIGPVKDDKISRKLIKDGNVKMIKWLSQNELAEHISVADLCLSGHFNNEILKAKRTIPGKAYIYEAMEKPMILGDNNATREIFKEDGFHYFVEMGNSVELAKKIIEVKNKMINQ